MDESSTRRWFESEIAKYGAIIVFFVPVLWYIAGIKTDIALIRQSIETIASEVKENKAMDAIQQKEIVELKLQVQKETPASFQNDDTRF